MSRLTRDGTAEPARETKFSGTHGDRGICIFPVQLTTSKIGNLTRLIHTLLYVMTIHTYIHTYFISIISAIPVIINPYFPSLSQRKKNACDTRWCGRTFACVWVISSRSRPAVTCRTASASTCCLLTTPSRGEKGPFDFGCLYGEGIGIEKG